MGEAVSEAVGEAVCEVTPPRGSTTPRGRTKDSLSYNLLT